MLKSNKASKLNFKYHEAFLTMVNYPSHFNGIKQIFSFIECKCKP